MNYPLQSLVIVAPILFIVLMIAIPLIGLAGGIKRALYWGGGNFIFYAIGLGVWFASNGAIGNLLGDLISKLSNNVLTKEQVAELGASVAAPVFFIIHLLIANLILLLVYLIWFRKWAKIGKYSVNDKRTQYPLSTRIGHRAAATVALPLLMLPTTFTFTQGVFFLTTSRATRSENKMAKNLYNGLLKISNDFHWFSYYGMTDTAKDFDALFSALSMLNKKILMPDGTEKPVIDALGETIQGGFSNIFDNLNNPGWKDEKQEYDLAGTMVDIVDDVAEKWNCIVDGAGEDVVAIFTSNSATEAIVGILGLNTGDDDFGKLDPNTFYDVYGSEGVFARAMDAYESGQWIIEGHEPIQFETELKKMEISSSAYNNLVESMKGFYDTTAIEGYPGMMETFDTRINQLVNLIFDKK